MGTLSADEKTRTAPCERRWLWGLIALHVTLGLLWAAVIPLFEAHDEVGHFYHVRHIARYGRLVPPGETLVDMWDESRQPPLYYVLAALPVSLINASDGPPYMPNPYAGWEQAQGGFNALVHDFEAEAFPWRGGVLAVRVARAVSTVLGALTLFVVFGAARRYAPTRPAVRWGAALGLALWPQFRFASSVVNNDALVTLSGALMVASLLGLLAAKQDERLRWLLAVGGACVLAALSKNNGLALAAVGALVAVAVVATHVHWRGWRILVPLGILGLGALAVGWWYARNLAGGQGALALPFMDVWLYQLRRLFLGQGLTARQIVGRFGTTGRFGWRSLWAAFGWGNVGYASPALYWLGAIWCLVGLLGLLGRPRWRVRSDAVGALVLALVVMAMLVPTWVLYVATGIPHFQGRYLLPVLPALLILVALGWDALVPERLMPWLGGTWASVLLIVAIATPWAVIAPAYAPPDALASEDLASFTPTLARFGEAAELVGHEIVETRVVSGGTLEVRLALRSAAASDLPLTLAVKAYDAAGQLVGSVHRYPGRGAVDTTRWESGFLFEERLELPLAAAAREGAGRLEISFYQAETPLSPLPVYDGAGTRLGRSLALPDAFRIRNGVEGFHLGTTAHQFGRVLTSSAPLVTFACDDGHPVAWVTWTWRAEREMEADYRVSLQLRAPDDTIVAQRDGPLAGGGVPTRLWDVGEVVPEQVVLHLPTRAGKEPLTLYLIVYDPASGERLPLAPPNGAPTGSNELLLERIDAVDLDTICP